MCLDVRVTASVGYMGVPAEEAESGMVGKVRLEEAPCPRCSCDSGSVGSPKTEGLRVSIGDIFNCFAGLAEISEA